MENTIFHANLVADMLRSARENRFFQQERNAYCGVANPAISISLDQRRREAFFRSLSPLAPDYNILSFTQQEGKRL
jgi:hypothetical protein